MPPDRIGSWNIPMLKGRKENKTRRALKESPTQRIPQELKAPQETTPPPAPPARNRGLFPQREDPFRVRAELAIGLLRPSQCEAACRLA